MAFLIPAVMGYIKSNWRNLIVVALVVAAATFLYVRGRHDAHAKDEARHKVEVAAALASNTKANAKAEVVTQQKAEIAAKQKEELTDAVAKAPDGLSDESSVRWGCQLMRQQGGRPSDVPACRALGL